MTAPIRTGDTVTVRDPRQVGPYQMPGPSDRDWSVLAVRGVAAHIGDSPAAVIGFDDLVTPLSNLRHAGGAR